MGMCRAVPPALLALVVGCSGIITSGGDDDDDTEDPGDDDGDDGTPVEPDPFEAAPAPLELPAEAIAGVSSQVHSLVEGSPFSFSVLIENRTTHQVVAEAQPERLLKPASNTKLYTTAAAFELLGEDHGLTTRVLGDTAIGGDGTVDGDLYIVLEHDFTMSSDLYDGPRVPLDRIARQLSRRGLTRVTGTVRVLGESVYEANSIGYLDLATERSQTTTAVGDALAAAGIARGGLASSAAMEPPAGAVAIFDHAPLTLAVGSSPLNTDSNNEFADLLVRHIGWRIEGESSGVVFHDGSGLSHDNRISARSTVGLLAFMEGTPVGKTWAHTFSIAGVRGTLGGRMTGGNTVGRVFGKTGSLRDTITLSGYLENKHDGQRYYFSVLFNNVADQTQARSLGDQVVATFAGNLRGAEPRLPAPALDRVRATGTPGVLDIKWSPVDGADSYLVWLSEDGRVWSRSQARLVRETRFHAGDLSASEPTFVRVTARAAGGLESDPSPTYAATASDDKAEILLVDANDRWLVQPAPENVLGAHHDFLAGLAQSAAAAGRVRIASASHAAVERGDVVLGDHAAVVWALGEESVTWTALSEAERGLIDDYVAGGGGLIASGAELVWALADQGSAAEKSFAGEVLGAGLESDDAATYEVVGEGPLADVGWTSFLAPDGMDINFPDSLVPASGGEIALRYIGGSGGAAAVMKGKVLVTGFPIEAVPSASARTELLGASLAAVIGATR